MKKILNILLILQFVFCFSQEVFPLKIKDVQDFFIDDYQNIYLHKNKNFSVTKYDKNGKELAKMLLTLPFRVENVQNPLNIALFSENAQQIKLIDYNLNEIQKIDLQNFGFVNQVYIEDLQQIWLLDESSKRLIQYNFRDNIQINSFSLFIDFSKIKDILVFSNYLFLLRENSFEIYDFSAKKIFDKTINNGRKLRRENENIYIITDKTIDRFSMPNTYHNVFRRDEAQIVDKNSTHFFELKQDKISIFTLSNSNN